MSFSRRRLLLGLFGLPLTFHSDEADAVNADAELVALGRRFAQLAAEFDFLLAQPISHDPDCCKFFGLIERLEPVEYRLTNLPATSIRGLSVKVEVARWSKQGVIDPSSHTCLDDRMAWSIVRDLLAIAAKGEAR